jgi:hypothetical protein
MQVMRCSLARRSDGCLLGRRAQCDEFNRSSFGDRDMLDDARVRARDRVRFALSVSLSSGTLA